MADERDNGAPLKRTFLVWSWIGLLGVIAPIVVLALACSVFLRYSVATYRMAVLDSPHEGDGEELLPLFRSSLVWLIAVWIVVLALKALPIVLSLPPGR